ncbi:MAG: AAA family ATPase [Oscillospiraceae bacterium]|nr:AAA family ATPase [Oscillospiraceae bacterium]
MAKNKIDALIEAVRNVLRKDDRYMPLAVYLSEIKREPSKNVFGSEDVLTELVNKILASDSQKVPADIISDAEKIYSVIVPLGEDTENYGTAKAVFLKLFERNGIYFRGLFTEKLYDVFADKSRYIETMSGLAEIPGVRKKINLISEHAVNVRQYFSDEKRFSSAVVSGAIKICRAQDPQAETEKLLRLAEKASGIYDISEESISLAEMSLRQTEEMLESARHTLALTDRRLDTFKEVSESSEASIKNTSLNEIEKLRREAKNAELELRKAYDSFLNEEHEGIIYEKDKLVQEVLDSADGKIRELKMIAESIKSSTSAELFRINTEANKAVDRAAAMLGSGELKDIISELERNDGLVEKIIRVEEFSRSFEPERIPVAVSAVSSEPVSIPVSAASASERQAQFRKYSEPADRSVNIYFNEAVPFKKRFAELMAKKERDISENGTIYHEHFDNILTAVVEDANPYLIGPSGCGKTFLVGQIAELLGLEYLDIGYINEEYDIIGFQTADGGYNYPAFYRAYKYGGIVFCDEFDNGNSRAAVKLNSFMANGSGASYCFPNGERVSRHPNFRIIAAGNTSGSGADRNYSTREKIEESLQQRFTAIYVDYDNRLEENILRDYPAWFEFAVRFRKATDAWSKANETAAPGIFTTRDAASIKKYLDHESYGAEDIISYEFIETKDNEYLAFLEREMKNFYDGKERESGELFKVFSRIVSDIRNGGSRR